MFCSNCGTENANNNQFCQNCGNALTTQAPETAFQPAPQAAPYQSFTPPQPRPQPQPKRPLSGNPVLNAVKTMGTSALFLIAIIAFSASALFSLFGAFSSNATGLLGTIFNYADDLGLSYIVDEAYGVFRGITVFTTILNLIPAALIITGLWMSFVSAGNRAYDGMKTSGLGIIKAVSIIQLIAYDLLIVVIEILLISATSSIQSDYYDTSGATSLFVFAMLIVAGIGTFLTLYYANILKTINTIKTTIITAQPSYKVSSFVAVMCFVSAVFSFFELFTAYGFFAVMQTLASIVSSVCFGIFLFKYKGKMTAMLAPANYQTYGVQQ